MRVVFVVGPPGAGKSTYVRREFQDADVVDLWDFQDYDVASVEAVWQSYLDCEKALKEALVRAKEREENGEDATVVLEHTLLMRKRRPMYVDAVREITDAPIEIHVLFPDEREYKRRCREAGLFLGEYVDMSSYELFEAPREDDGFSEIRYVR